MVNISKDFSRGKTPILNLYGEKMSAALGKGSVRGSGNLSVSVSGERGLNPPGRNGYKRGRAAVSYA